MPTKKKAPAIQFYNGDRRYKKTQIINEDDDDELDLNQIRNKINQFKETEDTGELLQLFRFLSHNGQHVHAEDLNQALAIRGLNTLDRERRD